MDLIMYGGCVVFLVLFFGAVGPLLSILVVLIACAQHAGQKKEENDGD